MSQLGTADHRVRRWWRRIDTVVCVSHFVRAYVLDYAQQVPVRTPLCRRPLTRSLAASSAAIRIGSVPRANGRAAPITARSGLPHCSLTVRARIAVRCVPCRAVPCRAAACAMHMCMPVWDIAVATRIGVAEERCGGARAVERIRLLSSDAATDAQMHTRRTQVRRARTEGEGLVSPVPSWRLEAKPTGNGRSATACHASHSGSVAAIPACLGRPLRPAWMRLHRS